MAINPDLIETKTIPQLPDLALALENFFAHSGANGIAGKANIQALVNIIQANVPSLDSSPFVPNTGSPLPNPIEKPTAITFVGIGTFDQTTGSDVVTTEELNVLFWSSNLSTGTWTIGVAINIDLTGYATVASVELKLDKSAIEVTTGKNKFDPNAIIDGYYVNTVSNVLMPLAGYKTSGVIKTNGSSKITISGLGAAHYALGVLYTLNDTTKSSFSIPGAPSGGQVATITPPSNSVSMQFTFKTDRVGDNAVAESIQVEFSSSATAFEVFKTYIKSIIVDGSSIKLSVDEVITNAVVTASPVNIGYLNGYALLKSSLETANLGLNKFIISDILTDTYINQSPGNRKPLPLLGYTSSGRIPCKELFSYSLGGFSSLHYALGLVYYDSDDVTLAGFASDTLAADLTEYEISTPATAKYFQFTVITAKPGDTTSVSNIMVNEGTTLLAYELGVLSVVSINGYPIAGATTAYIKTQGLKGLFFGDSITATNVITNWPSYAMPLLKITDFVNYAQSGAHWEDFSTVSPRQKMTVQVSDAIASGYQPDIIIVSIGTNSLNQPTGLTDADYTATMAKSIGSLVATNISDAVRLNLYNIANNWPNARLFYGVPLQRTAFSVDAMRTTVNVFMRFARYYNFMIINAFDESGIVKDFEVPDANGRWLIDGLHPNEAGKKLLGNYYANEILNKYSSTS